MSKSKSKNGKTSSQDYMNLLYTDSESDTVPDLKLPPLKGKKPKRRSLRRTTEENVCSLWMVLKAVTVTILLASVVTLGIVTYWSLQQIRDLKDQINTLENKNAGTPEEFQALQTKLMLVNKTVNDIKTGKNGLEVLNRSIVNMQKEITSLTATAAQLQQSVESTDSSEKEQIAVANTVADLGSGLQTTKADVESLKASQKALTTQLEALNNRLSLLENPSGRERGSSDSDIQDVQALLSQINATFTQSIGMAAADLSKQQAHMDVLDKLMQGLQDQVQNVSLQVANLTQSQQHLEAYVTQQVTSKKPVNAGVEDESSQAETPLSLLQLQGQVQDLQHKLEQIQSDRGNLTQGGPAGDSSTSTISDSDVQVLKEDHKEFMVFRTEVFQDLSSLNASLVSVNGSIRALNSDVGELFAKVGLAMTEISNVTTVVEGLTNFLQTKMTSSLPATAAVEGGKVSETPRSTTTQPASTEPAPPSGDSGPNAQSLEEKRPSKEKGKASKDQGSTTAQPQPAPPSGSSGVDTDNLGS